MKCGKCNMKMHVVDTRTTGDVTFRKSVCKTCGSVAYTKEQVCSDLFEAYTEMARIREESRVKK